MALLQSACKRPRGSCSPLLAVADLERRFSRLTRESVVVGSREVTWDL